MREWQAFATVLLPRKIVKWKLFTSSDTKKRGYNMRLETIVLHMARIKVDKIL